jgi:adenylate cyclase
MPDGAGGNPSHRMRMTVAFANSMLTPPKTNSGDIDAWLVLPRVHRVVLVVDVVESVRLMEQDEEDTITRWRAFVHGVERELLPQHGGRLVKSLGDGLMLEFERVLPAVQSALAMQQLARTMNQGRAAERCMFLRMGVHAADVVVDDRDIYGAGVNLAARLATLAGPGEVVVSAEVRDELVEGFDAELEDLGDCYLKHVRQAVRAYRAGPGSSEKSLVTEHGTAPGRPVIAVLPIALVGGHQHQTVVAAALTDQITASLSKQSELQVVSALSCAAFLNRSVPLSVVQNSLNTSYVVHGKCYIHGHQLRVHLEVADARDEHIVWADSLTGTVDEVFACDGALVPQAAEQVCQAILACQVRRAATQPLPTLESYALLMGGIGLMHRASAREFDRARTLLEHLIERQPRAPHPRAWLGKWFAIRAAQGWSPDLQSDAREAISHVRRALDSDSGNSLALTIEGLIRSYIQKDMATAADRYARALEANPSEPLAWLYTAVLNAWLDRGAQAVQAADTALRLSPLDPLRYYFDSLAGSAHLAAGNYAEAMALSSRSLRSNRSHASTYRTLAIAQVLQGQLGPARQTVSALLRIEPALTVSTFRERYPGRDSAHARTYCEALLAAGLPP